ncbi:MAG: hypothetical protein V1734_02350 [Nanoarchaeota archaeon]
MQEGNSICFVGDKNLENIKELKIHKLKSYSGKIRFRPIHMAVDLILKREHNMGLTKDFIKFLLATLSLRINKQQMKSYMDFASSKKLKQFNPLNKYGDYSVEFITAFIKFVTAQKTANDCRISRFKAVLEAIQKDKDIFSIVTTATS